MLEGDDRVWRVGPPALGSKDADFMAILATDPLVREPHKAREIRLKVRDNALDFSGTYEGKTAAAGVMEQALTILYENHERNDPAAADAERILWECIFQLRRFVPVDRYVKGDRGENPRKGRDDG